MSSIQRSPYSGRRPEQERPRCFGLGMDLDSGQRVPVTACQMCPADVAACSLLRIARDREARGHEQQDRRKRDARLRRLGYVA